jgi:hypothetical protein
MTDIKELEKLPEPIKQEIIDFADYLIDRYKLKNRQSSEDSLPETAILSEESLSRDWSKPEEEEAWKTL